MIHFHLAVQYLCKHVDLFLLYLEETAVISQTNEAISKYLFPHSQRV